MDGIRELAERWEQARHAVVLTGAGASTDSGLPDFRSREGLWKQVDPMKLASINALRQNPVEFYQFYRMRLSRLRDAAPNTVHRTLAKMQETGRIAALITQNIDGLHQMAGSHAVIEMHGNLREAICLGCGRRFSSRLIDVDVTTTEEIPVCPACSGTLKPGVILFGESLPMEALERAYEAAEQADLFVVIGSSLEVGPVNQLPAVATHYGADLAIINLEPTHLDRAARWVIRDRAASVLDHCRRLMGL